EIGCSFYFCQFSNVEGKVPPATLPISPLEGEMSGRTEGGVQALTSEHDCMEGATLAACCS
ncbi:hypothetical protein, partial [Mesorhizobium sp.]|uniref:hypothetical protein n=1 Tax=Mesorhizobium sp. TaxID=1871066 RepID=UPI0025B8F550